MRIALALVWCLCAAWPGLAAVGVSGGRVTSAPSDWTFAGSIDGTLSADTNDWAPSGVGTATVVRITASTTTRTLTGINATTAGAATGRALILRNVGSFDVVLAHDVTSTAANRFYLAGGDYRLVPGSQAILLYDATIGSGSTGRWVVFQGAPALYVDGAYVSTLDGLNLSSADVDCTMTGTTTGGPICTFKTTIGRTGSCVGEAADWCGTVQPTGKDVNFSDANTTTAKTTSSCAPTASGQWCYDSDSFAIGLGDGTRTRWFGPEFHEWTIGGTATSNAFTYGGEGSGACSGDICRGGTCSGTTPTGTCTLTANSYYGFAPGVGTNVAVSQSAALTATQWVLTYSSVSITAGTVTVGTADNRGSTVVIRSLGNFSHTGGTINLAGKGAKGAGSGTVTANNAGKPAGCLGIQCGPTPGAAGANAGTAGYAAPTPSTLYAGFGMLLKSALFHGSGGGSIATGGTAPYDVAPYTVSFGGTGGSGAGCPASASGTPGGGGAGGGGLRIESYGSITIGASAIIDLRGDNGGTGGSGGGGGSLGLIARSVSNSATKDTSIAPGSSCTSGKICVKGGNAASTWTTGATCGANAAGGNGEVYTFTVPM